MNVHYLHLTKMKAYALVYVEKGIHVARTHGSKDPTWNETVRVKFRHHLLENDVMPALHIDIYDRGHITDQPAGGARVLLCDVLKGGKPDEPADNPIQCMTVQVWRPSGRPQGLLNLWVPPTGKFLLRKESLSFGVMMVVQDGGGGGGDGGCIVG